MKAMIFAAGLGTRLKPITDRIPKALLPIGGRTLLEWQLEKLRHAGITEVVINIHHFPEQIVEFCKFSDESDMLLETGGGLRKAGKLLRGDEPILVMNVDVLSNIDLEKVIAAHTEERLATIVVSERKTQRYFVFDKDYKLNGWINKKTGETKPATLSYSDGEMIERAFGGVHVISPEIFPLLEKHAKGEDVFSITPFYIEQCNSCHIHGYESATAYNWLDVGNPETLEEANRLFGK